MLTKIMLLTIVALLYGAMTMEEIKDERASRA